MKIEIELTIFFDRPARAGGKRKRAPFTSDDPTYKPTWSWDPSDHSSEFMSGNSLSILSVSAAMSNSKCLDDESVPRPSAAKKTKTVAEPEVKVPKVSFRPTGKGGKKKLAPFQSEDPSYKPPKDHSDESDVSDVGMFSPSFLIDPSCLSLGQNHQLTNHSRRPT